MNLDEIKSFVASYSDAMRRLETDLATTQWQLATTGSEEATQRMVELEVEYRSLFANADDFARLRRWHQQRDQIDDHILRRQVEHLYLAFLASHTPPELARPIAELSASIDSRYMNFRAVYEGHPVSNNVIRQVLKSETSSDRVREAWEASKQIGPEVAADVVRLAELRNEVGRSLGYPNYYAQALAAQELDEERLFNLLDQLEQETREPFRALKEELDQRLARRFGISVSQLRPWHYAEPFFQEAPPTENLDVDRLYADTSPEEVARTTFQGMGMEIDDILARSDLYERDHKDQHAFAIHVDRLTDDVRILCNLRSDAYWTETMLHEMGHGVYDKYLAPDLPFLLRSPAHTSSTEAIAMLMGRLTHNPSWLREVMTVPESELNKLSRPLTQEQRLGMLVFMRWALVVVHFERAFYANPQRQDLNQLWWSLVERFQMLHAPEGRDQPDWAAKIHIALYPAYYQNYILGELTASQLQHYLTDHFGGVVNKQQAGNFLREHLFRLGALYPWDETVKQVTGEYLNPEYFAQQFVSPVAAS